MNARLLPAAAAEPPENPPRPVSAARLQGRWLLIARVTWIALASMLLVIFVANLPAFFQYAGAVCTLPDARDCPTEQLTLAYVRVAEQLHLSVVVAQLLLTALCLALALLYWLLGLLIFWRKSDEWIGLLVSLMLVMFAATGFIGFNLPTRTPTLFELLAQIITHALMWPAMLVYFFTFPTGRFTPRWTWAAFVPFFVVGMLASIPLSVSATRLVPNVAVVLASLLPVVVQVYRYVRVYDAVQRQQTKWFVFGMTLVFVLIIIQGLLQIAAPASRLANEWHQIFSGPFWLLPWTLLLLSVSIPILRYRLWDIDLIINRTLVYGSLTMLLGAIYAGVILAVQLVGHALTGQTSVPAWLIVATTLLVAALFNPVRRRLQAAIDRRFYRSKYDAARTLAAFSATLHTETDLPQASAQLLAVVRETMQPAHVSLWLSSGAWDSPPARPLDAESA